MPESTLEISSADGVPLDAVAHTPNSGVSRATVVQAHGICADRDEGGMFARLGERLGEVGFTAVRFSFRGHGSSGGASRGATIAGEALDLDAVLHHARASYPGPLVIVTASFGAVATGLTVPYLDLAGLVLWNPVLDLRRTFTHPELPWGLDNFGPTQQERLAQTGSLFIDGEWELGRVMFDEMRWCDPLSPILADTTPVLAIHGDEDTYVPYEVTQMLTDRRQNAELHTVTGSDHGFDSREHEDEAIAVTIDWLERRFPAAR